MKIALFDNPGKKIKTIAIVCFVVIVVASVICAVSFGISKRFIPDYSNYSHSYYKRTLHPKVFFPILIGGSFAAYVSSLFLYGFGELIENSKKQQ